MWCNRSDRTTQTARRQSLTLLWFYPQRINLVGLNFCFCPWHVLFPSWRYDSVLFSLGLVLTENVPRELSAARL